MARLTQKNIGILITDHNVQETLAITDRTYLMFEGSILKAGEPEVLANDEMVRKVYLGQNLELRKKKIFTSRTVRFATFEKIGFEEVKKLSMQNLDDLEKMLYWNKENGIHVFRMSSEMFPHISNLNIFNIDYDAALELSLIHI